MENFNKKKEYKHLPENTVFGGFDSSRYYLMQCPCDDEAHRLLFTVYIDDNDKDLDSSCISLSVPVFNANGFYWKFSSAWKYICKGVVKNGMGWDFPFTFNDDVSPKIQKIHDIFDAFIKEMEDKKYNEWKPDERYSNKYSYEMKYYNEKVPTGIKKKIITKWDKIRHRFRMYNEGIIYSVIPHRDDWYKYMFEYDKELVLTTEHCNDGKFSNYYDLILSWQYSSRFHLLKRILKSIRYIFSSSRLNYETINLYYDDVIVFKKLFKSILNSPWLFERPNEESQEPQCEQ